MLKGKTVVLGVTGSIAAYKMANVASMLVKLHADVHVIMTENATNFINPIICDSVCHLADHIGRSRCYHKNIRTLCQCHMLDIELERK